MDKCIFLVTERCYQKEVQDLLDRDNYFFAEEVTEGFDEDYLRGQCVLQVTPHNDLVGLGESRLFSLNTPSSATEEMKRVVTEVYQNNLPLLEYDIDQWLMLIKELIWDHGMRRVGIYFYYKGNSPSVYNVKNVSIGDVSREDIIHLREHMLLNVRA